MMKNSRFLRAGVGVVILLAAALATADTFRHRETGEVIKGSLLGTAHEGGRQQYLVRTADGSRVVLSTTDWERTAGPSPVVAHPPRGERLAGAAVCFVQVEGPLESRRGRDEILRAIAAAGERAPRALVVEIDTPGGRVDYAQHICRALDDLRECKTVAFIRGGRYQGAFSAGALIAMGCQELFMAEGCSIGAAAPFVASKDGAQFSDKVTSAFSATFRALAEKHKRPAAIAGAMVDADAELREVVIDGTSHYEPTDRAKELADAGGKLGRWVKRRGKPLTLTAGEAAELGIATGTAASREALLAALGLADAKAIDLDTTEAIKRAVAEDARTAASLRRQIDAEKRALAACHPKFATYPRRRESARAAIERVDKCLALYEKLLDLARGEPALGYDEADISKDIVWLTAQKQRLLGY